MRLLQPIVLPLVAVLLTALCASPLLFRENGPRATERERDPNDYFYLQRAYPDAALNVTAYVNALRSAQAGMAQRGGPKGFDAPWTTQGPGNIGARANCIAVDPRNDNVMYAGFAVGGLYKTTDGGRNWVPIFDKQLFLSIGDIAIDPKNPDVIYAGTGDPNIGGYPFIGDGLYKSTDGGNTWTHLGLENERIISRIVIDPTNSNNVYVACMGLPFEANNYRGLYRSADGGKTFKQILFVSNQTGITDVLINPQFPNILYAAAWDRLRNNKQSVVSGANAKIYKSFDSGNTWTALGGGLPTGNQCRIALAMSGKNFNTIYARYIGTNLQLQGIYKTLDGGQFWTKVPTTGLNNNAMGGFGWYFGRFFVNPNDDNDLFLLGVRMWRTQNGGQNWKAGAYLADSSEVHADLHDMAFTASGKMILTTDGGVYASSNNGAVWEDIENIPTNQFYRVAYNPNQPDRYFGGLQDNGTVGGNKDGFNDWDRLFGGDGFQAVFHPTNPNLAYYEYQNGGIFVYYNNQFRSGTTGIQDTDRKHWDMQYFMSVHNPNVLYAGTQRVYRSTAGPIPDWKPISGDLTRGVIYISGLHTITTLTESPLRQGFLYVGTGDGNLWRSPDDGGTWEPINNGLPDRYITCVKASPNREGSVFVSLSGYKDNDFVPHLYFSSNRGDQWQDASGDLPGVGINDVLIMPYYRDSVIFVATDAGVYATLDAGTSWNRLGGNMPIIPVYDLEWNSARNELVAGTHGRSLMTFALDSIGVRPKTTGLRNLSDPVGGLSIAPLPAGPTVWLRAATLDDGPADLLVYTLTGQLALQRETAVAGGAVEFESGRLSPGMYVVTLRQGRRLYTGKMVKQ